MYLEPLAEVPGHLALVVDASAAAASPLGDTSSTRWEAVRTTLPDVIAQEVAAQQVTLVRVGGTPVACEANVTLLAEGEPATSAAWRDALGNTVPAGAAPLAEALLQAADHLPPGTRRSLILIASGAPPCGDDLCAVARVLERAATDVTVHVVDLGDDPAVAGALRCVAEATGGTYYQASDLDTLRAGIRDAVRHALGGQLRVEVSSAGDHPLFPAIVVGRGDRVISTFDAWTDADLASGVYSVSVGLPLPAVFPRVPVVAGQRTRLSLAQGELHVNLVDPVGRPVRGEIVLSAAERGPFFSMYAEQVAIPLAAGRYTITVRLDPAVEPLAVLEDVPVQEGAVTTRVLTLEVGVLRVQLRRGDQPASAFVEVAPEDRPEHPLLAGWASNTFTSTLPGGVYRARVSQYDAPEIHLLLEDVRVSPGEETTVDVLLGQGTLAVAATAEDGSHVSGRVFIYPAGREDAPYAEAQVGEAVSLPVGTYDLRVESDAGATHWLRGVRVSANTHQTVTIPSP